MHCPFSLDKTKWSAMHLLPVVQPLISIYVQGGPSGRGMQSVDIKLKVPLEYKLLIRKCNSYLNVNKRLSVTRWATLYGCMLGTLYFTCPQPATACTAQFPLPARAHPFLPLFAPAHLFASEWRPTTTITLLWVRGEGDE